MSGKVADLLLKTLDGRPRFRRDSAASLIVANHDAAQGERDRARIDLIGCAA